MDDEGMDDEGMDDEGMDDEGFDEEDFDDEEGMDEEGFANLPGKQKRKSLFGSLSDKVSGAAKAASDALARSSV